MSLNHIVGILLFGLGGFVFFTGTQIQGGNLKWTTLCQSVAAEESAKGVKYQERTAKYNKRVGALFACAGMLSFALNSVLIFAVSMLVFWGGMVIYKAQKEIELKG